MARPSRAKGAQSKMRSKPLLRERGRGVIVSWVSGFTSTRGKEFWRWKMVTVVHYECI